MTTPLLPLLPNSELVCAAYLRDVVSTYDVGVGTVLQGPDPETGVLTWGTTGFVTFAVVGGSPLVDVPVRNPVMSVDCWATNVGKKKPPRGRAYSIAEVLWRAVHDLESDTPSRRAVTLPTGYPGAVVHAAAVRSEPAFPPGDAANFAHVQFQLEMWWASL